MSTSATQNMRAKGHLYTSRPVRPVGVAVRPIQVRIRSATGREAAVGEGPRRFVRLAPLNKEGGDQMAPVPAR